MLLFLQLLVLFMESIEAETFHCCDAIFWFPSTKSRECYDGKWGANCCIYGTCDWYCCCYCYSSPTRRKCNDDYQAIKPKCAELEEEKRKKEENKKLEREREEQNKRRLKREREEQNKKRLEEEQKRKNCEGPGVSESDKCQ
ncbi:uncharacterized protein LOC117780238 [Drosophila innubila]|uniref:uncharacterized protein LOC117780238 n=1 Tax=Drosophila innubila TaxID=198719 RepID=UPI00148BCE38|nr:uncharacterized protein LOC117780238 [Drosophila innubila]